MQVAKLNVVKQILSGACDETRTNEILWYFITDNSVQKFWKPEYFSTAIIILKFGIKQHNPYIFLFIF